MNERIFSIVDVTDDFESFADSFQGLNYNVGIYAKMFQHHGLTDFTLEDLRSLFPGEDIRGIFEQIDFSEVRNKVRKGFTYTNNEEGGIVQSKDLGLIRKREERFWKIVNNFFPLPPVLVYKHGPYGGSFFDFYVFWHFSYVFLDKKQGLFIDAESYD